MWGQEQQSRARYHLLQVVVFPQHLHQAQDALLHDAVVRQLQREDSRVGLQPPQGEGEREKDGW